MTFDDQKKLAVATLFDTTTPDKSRAGSYDKEIEHLLITINKHPDYYTTSSCAGRILVSEAALEDKKFQNRWLLVSHQPISVDTLMNALAQRSTHTQYDVWFKMEAPILHICARDLASGMKLIKAAQQAGIKHASLLNDSPRVMVEIFGRMAIEAPLCHSASLLVDQSYLDVLCTFANNKLTKSRIPFDTLCKEFFMQDT